MSQAMDAVMGALDTVAQDSETEAVEMAENAAIDAGEIETEASKKDPQFIHMPLTPELLAACRAQAGTEALGPWLQRRLAGQLNVTLPVKTDGRQRYTTEEQRQAAKLAARDKAANLRKGLLMAHRARAAGDAVKLAEAEALIAANS
ncbi:MAG: hypothetical protein EHM23_00860 [Acidobacteria bacterium]|nr:MAG: hypothetical protein EHM23_00860 [Acidobacteriota bacterium]